MIYFDSCYLAKLYLMEQDSPRVRTQAEASDGLACCSVGRGEVIAAFHRHFREKRLTQREFRRLAAQVDADLETIECPKHGSTFDLNTGKPRTLPATLPVETYDVKIDGDDVLIEVNG